MIKVHPYLLFNGECDTAFKFYEEVFGGKITFKMTFAESPAANMVPESARNLIIHATLTIGEQLIMASDAPPDRYQRPQGTHVSVHVDSRNEGERIFQRLSVGGEVQMPFEQTFWAPAFGMCTDRFGIPWMIQCDAEG